MLALPAMFAAGCAARGGVDMLESRLRQHEQAEQELTAQLEASREELRVARADADALRTQYASRGQFALASEQAEVLYKAESLRFNSLLTGGFNRDGLPGDEGLSVLLLPADSTGDLVKLVGSVELELFDLAQPSGQQRLGHWQFAPDEVREHWHRGFLSAGYLFRVDWQQIPAATDLTLHARMSIPDGRNFDATTQIKVAPPGSAGAAPPIAQARRAPPRNDVGDDRVVPSQFEATAPGPREVNKPAILPRIAPAEAAASGHAPLRTSDNWTEETIPRLR